MYNLLDKRFNGIVKISELCEKGMISQEKIRDRFLTDPAFATVVRNNPHCFQPFGLGDKMIPSEAHAANEKNKIPDAQKIGEPFTLNFKKPVTIKDLPGFDPKDPTKNLPHIAETSSWFKPKGSKS